MNLWFAVLGGVCAVWMGLIGQWVPLAFNVASAVFNGWVWWATRERPDASRQ